MEPIIGLDFGNYNTFPCFISDFDIDTRMGGEVKDLVPGNPEFRDGIPSVYFYSQRVGKVLLGDVALRGRAVPERNRLRYLKRHIGETTVLDDRTIIYDDAITEVVQYAVRIACKRLQSEFGMSTNLVALSYPASYSYLQRLKLIRAVEKATLEDGTNIKVFGTIAEPAAAALDYLAEFARTDQETTVLAFDLGGGTFDLGLVAAYPNGKRRENGDVYYYDILNTRGAEDLGGKDFDDVMCEIMRGKIRVTLNENEKKRLETLAEATKVQLSNSEEETVSFEKGDQYIEFEVTRNEFEKASEGIVERMMDLTRSVLGENQNRKPEVILLTGGASQMPMIQRALEETFPEYKGKIIAYRPNKAIAYGAARFGTAEGGSPDPGMIQQRLMYDIGIRYYREKGIDDLYIDKFLSAGTPIPCTSRVVYSTQREEGRTSAFNVFEATVDNPDQYESARDYRKIGKVTLEHGRIVPKGFPHEARMRVNEKGILIVEARGRDREDLPWKDIEVKLEHLE